MFLVSGQLVLYHVARKSALHLRQAKNISLLDAYVCSGYFAALALPEGQYNPTAPTVARRYQDGLEADDPEEDMLFMIWYHKQKRMDIGTVTDTSANDASVPKTLSHKRKLVVCRTRSKLERDAWCWALNCEIEKLVRLAKTREDKLRATGGIVDL
jgi:Pleckstrin homology domain